MTRPDAKNKPASKSMNVAGIMSGTSADGIDVAIARIAHGRRGHRVELLAFEAFPFSKPLRAAVLASMDARSTSTAELARLNWHLGFAYAEAVTETLKKHPIKIDLIGCHGQTIYHQPTPGVHAGKKLACTWQIGEMAMLASETGVPVISNFRPADMVAGGQGAPLVPFLDFAMFCHPTRGRVLQNLGGIGNLTAIPAGASIHEVIAFDTGPANMVIDALTAALFGRRFDRNGAIAAKGTVLPAVLKSALRHPFFRLRPPKSAGREEFGLKYSDQFLAECRKASSRDEDALATATALSARTITEACERFVAPLMKEAPVDFFVSGGGARNKTLVSMLEALLTPLGWATASTDTIGMPAQAKEPVAFALLAYETWRRQPGNVPAATGARRPAILGDITYA